MRALSMHNGCPCFIVITAVSASLFAACESINGSTPTAPTAPTAFLTAANPTFTVAVEPRQLFRRRVHGATCPVRQPFLLPFHLLLESASGSPFFLNQVGIEFIDSAGTSAPRITLRHSDLIRRFGTVQIPSQGSRSFPLSFEFGCATEPTGTLSVFVETISPGRPLVGRTVTMMVR
jgi:hypothetical protein